MIVDSIFGSIKESYITTFKLKVTITHKLNRNWVFVQL